jgi:hypothetical protein
MPGLNGTGPFGRGQMTGRKSGRCGFGPVPPEFVPSSAKMPESSVQSGKNQNQTLPQAQLYGTGHGGIPYGCGKGRVFGGGRGCRRE